MGSVELELEDWDVDDVVEVVAGDETDILALLCLQSLRALLVARVAKNEQTRYQNYNYLGNVQKFMTNFQMAEMIHLICES